MDTKIYTSDEILAMETEEVCSLGEIPITYQLTEGEWEWVLFTKGKYCIADYVLQHVYVVPETDEKQVTMDSYHFSESMDGDNKGAGKATMLSDDSALQRIFFCCYTETDDDDDTDDSVKVICNLLDNIDTCVSNIINKTP
jgi:hypothetical protein